MTEKTDENKVEVPVETEAKEPVKKDDKLTDLEHLIAAHGHIVEFLKARFPGFAEGVHADEDLAKAELHLNAIK